MKELINWEYLGSITGVSTVTGLMTQLIKPYIPIPTQIVAYIVAVLLLVAYDIYKKDYSRVPLSLINGFIIASLTSNTVSVLSRLGVAF